MRYKFIVTFVFVTLLLFIFPGCKGEQSKLSDKEIATVTRGDLVVTVSADGTLKMPREVQLKFGTPGTVKEVRVKKGDKVKTGTLLAKLDDSTQKLAVEAAQYKVELALNDLLEKVHPAVMGYPRMYPDPVTAVRAEQAVEELKQAQEYLSQDDHLRAASQLRLAIHDLQAVNYLLKVPPVEVSLESIDELTGEKIENYPEVSRAIRMVEQGLRELDEIQVDLEKGNLNIAKLTAVTQQIYQTYQQVKNISGRVRMSQRIGECCQQLTVQGMRMDSTTGGTPVPYPDTSTALAWLEQVENSLQNIQVCQEQSCDELEFATKLRMAQHDIETSRKILENNELVFRSGVNLKTLRAANLNIQIAEADLRRAKEELMKTEILAPFDGTVVDVGVKVNDQLSSFDYSSKTAVYLVDTSTVELEATVDEVDIYKVKVGQEAIVTTDALPEVELKGKVTFVSPVGTSIAGVVEFPVTIALEQPEIELKGGLTASADIVVKSYPNVLLLPNRAVKGSPGDYYVEVVIDEVKGLTEKQPVHIGAQNDQFTEIVSGVEEGEKVVMEPVKIRSPLSFH
jgi:RND family efflux transporter MFP subunit